MNEFSNKMFTANEMEICGAIGFVLGIVSVLLTAAIMSAISSRQEPTPTDDYFDLEYERWRVQKQAEADLSRQNLTRPHAGGKPGHLGRGDEL